MQGTSTVVAVVVAGTDTESKDVVGNWNTLHYTAALLYFISLITVTSLLTEWSQNNYPTDD